MTGFQKDATQRSKCSLCKKQGGTHTTHIRTARSMIPMGPLRRTSKGQNQLEPLMDPRDLLKEEVAMHNYPLKSTNLKSPTRKWNTPWQNRRSASVTKQAIATIQTHREMMGWGVIGIYIVNQTVIKNLPIILVRLKQPHVPIYHFLIQTTPAWQHQLESNRRPRKSSSWTHTE